MISLCACTPSLEVDTIEVGVVRALCIDETEREYSQLRLISYCNSGIVPTVSITFYFPSSLGISPLFTQSTENLSTSSLSLWSERYSYTLQWNAAFAVDAIAAKQIVTVRAIVIGMSVVTYESSVAESI